MLFPTSIIGKMVRLPKWVQFSLYACSWDGVTFLQDTIKKDWNESDALGMKEGDVQAQQTNSTFCK